MAFEVLIAQMKYKEALELADTGEDGRLGAGGRAGDPEGADAVFAGGKRKSEGDLRPL